MSNIIKNINIRVNDKPLSGSETGIVYLGDSERPLVLNIPMDWPRTLSYQMSEYPIIIPEIVWSTVRF